MVMDKMHARARGPRAGVVQKFDILQIRFTAVFP